MIGADVAGSAAKRCSFGATAGSRLPEGEWMGVASAFGVASSTGRGEDEPFGGRPRILPKRR